VAVVPEERVEALIGLARRRGILGVEIGSITHSGKIQVFFAGEKIVDLDSKFIRGQQPRTEEVASLAVPDRPTAAFGDLAKEGVETLLRIMSHPNVCSREWLIRQLDHEVQGTSALKPLHTISNFSRGCSQWSE